MQKLLLYICIVLLCAQCAQITPLTGGKKDLEAPKPLSFKPENVSLNFNSKTIVIQFNEYIVLKDIANQFIITPQTKESPEIESSGKTLKISFNETLLPNTTYKLAFGNAITDLNESNVLKDFEYIFSTGTTIDSLKLTGNVQNAFDKKPSYDVLIGLYNNDTNDSIIYKEKPLYISKTNESGNFSFNYLPNKAFKIVGIKDQNKNLMYDGSEEQIAYSKKTVTPANPNIPTDSSDLSMLLFKEVPSKNFVRRTQSNEYGKASVAYNKPQLDVKEVTADGLISYDFNKLNDTLNLYFANKYDTLETYVKHNNGKIDTLYIRILSLLGVEKQIKNKNIKYSFRTNVGGVFPFYEMPVFELNVPAADKNIIADKMILLEQKDSLIIKKPFTILKNSPSTKTFTVKAQFEPETNYTLALDKGAVTDNAERTNDSITYKFKTNTVDDYAQLNLKLFFPKKENYILMLLNDKEQIVDQRVIEFSLASTSEKLVEYKNLIPGSYFIKVAEDANKNGAFDTGDYFLKQQPETIFMNTTPIKLLAGWEIENEWIVK